MIRFATPDGQARVALTVIYERHLMTPVINFGRFTDRWPDVLSLIYKCAIIEFDRAAFVVCCFTLFLLCGIEKECRT